MKKIIYTCILSLMMTQALAGEIIFNVASHFDFLIDAANVYYKATKLTSFSCHQWIFDGDPLPLPRRYPSYKLDELPSLTSNSVILEKYPFEEKCKFIPTHVSNLSLSLKDNNHIATITLMVRIYSKVKPSSTTLKCSVKYKKLECRNEDNDIDVAEVVLNEDGNAIINIIEG